MSDNIRVSNGIIGSALDLVLLRMEVGSTTRP